MHDNRMAKQRTRWDLTVVALAMAMAAFLSAAVQAQPGGAADGKKADADKTAETADALVGKFAKDDLSVEVERHEGKFRGTITRGEKKYTFTGEQKGPLFRGVADVDGDPTGFSLSLAGDELTLKLGLDTHKLTRVAPLPLPPRAKPANTIRKEVLLATNDQVQLGSIAVSPDNRRVAFIVQRDGHRRFAINGVEGKPYFRAFRITFSPDGGRYFYFAQRTDGQVCFVVDGVEGEPFDTLAEEAARFSPDGKRIAYAARRGEKWRLVVDGKEGPLYDGIQFITFSPDSSRLAYGAQKDGKWRVVIDGIEQPAYDDLGRAGIQFSADGKHVAYTAIKGTLECLVIDGKEGKLHDAVPGFHLSADGRQSHYFALRDRRYVFVADGKEKATYDKLEGLSFSADGRRTVLGATNGGKSFHVIDDQPQAPFDEISAPIFSADSKQVAYVGKRDGKWRLIRDQLEGEPHDAIPFLVISPDGRRLAYAAVDGKVMAVMVDGKATGSYSELWSGGLHFGPEGRHLVYGARRGDQWFLVVDGVEGEPIGQFVADSQPLFDGPSQFSIVTRRGANYHRLEVRIIEPKPAK